MDEKKGTPPKAGKIPNKPGEPDKNSLPPQAPSREEVWSPRSIYEPLTFKPITMTGEWTLPKVNFGPGVFAGADELPTYQIAGRWDLPGERERELSKQIEELREEYADKSRQALEARNEKGQADAEIAALRQTVEKLEAKERLNFILNRIHPDARPHLLASTTFRDAFLRSDQCSAFVMSIDIRRSTELMLKARQPELFAKFITRLCAQLRDIVLGHNGVFDKFTGDGILAFFPDFYSGRDAGYYAVAAAAAAHRAFGEHYDASRSCFTSILRDVGLGIGIDYGTTHLVQLGDGLTVVGTPVVYACRMGAGAAGETLLNQPAFEQVFDRFSAVCTFAETELNTKYEGPQVAYSVTPNGKAYTPNSPDWQSFQKDENLGETKLRAVEDK